MSHTFSLSLSLSHGCSVCVSLFILVYRSLFHSASLKPSLSNFHFICLSLSPSLSLSPCLSVSLSLFLFLYFPLSLCVTHTIMIPTVKHMSVQKPLQTRRCLSFFQNVLSPHSWFHSWLNCIKLFGSVIAHLHWQSFYAKTSVNLVMWCHLPYLPWPCDWNRNDPICVALPKVAKASKELYIV